jgi:hypothetical protein
MMAIYAAIMIGTNSHFTILDDESTIVAVAGHPIGPTVSVFLFGKGQHEHPPLSDILLHLWLVATNYSFFWLRIFANLFFIAAMFLTAKSAERLSGKSAYWTTLVVGFVWPFAFQYGRITGWYCFTMFLVSLVTWLYLRVIAEESGWAWFFFAFAGIALVWSNYFGVAILALLLVDLLIFNRNLARKNIRPLLMSVAAVVLCSIPLVRIVLADLAVKAAPSHVSWKRLIPTIGYPTFSLFGSVAVAPWFLPLSLPIFAAMIALFVALWFSPSRKWMVYFVLSLVLLQLSGHMNVKRVVFLLPWLFLGIGGAAFSPKARYPRMVLAAIATFVIVGWVGIVSGKHYSTTNLYEPWRNVAQVAAGDARRGATIISENSPFFFYLNYALGLEAETGTATGSYLGKELYESHGYRVLYPSDWQTMAHALSGNVVVVNGSADTGSVQWTNALDNRLRQRCRMLSEYRAAPDPSAALKRKFANDVAVLIYRVDVSWYDCGIPQTAADQTIAVAPIEPYRSGVDAGKERR